MNELWDGIRQVVNLIESGKGRKTPAGKLGDLTIVALLDLHDRLTAIEERLDRLEDK